MVIAHQTSLLELHFWRDIGQASQILVHDDRADHLHDVWFLCAGRVLIASDPGLFGTFCLGEHVRERARSDQRHKDAEQAKH